MTPPVDALALNVLLASFEGPTLPPEWEALLGDGLGGICLFGSNIGDGTGTRALADAIHAANPAALVAADEEGGDVTRLHALRGSTVVGPAVLGAVDDLDLTRDVGRLVAADLVAAGIDLALAPVADVNSNPDNPVIGTRSFSSDPTVTAAHVAAWVRGVQEAGVAACAKHFPGHGDTAADSHLALPVLDVPLDTLRHRELVPFAAAVEAGVRTVMTSHIVVPALDPELPGTLSPGVLALLRDELGFDGVIVSDALDMAGALVPAERPSSTGAVRGIPEAAVLSLAAGADLLCIGADKPATLIEEIRAAIVDAVADGRLPLARLEDAARRVASLAASRPPSSAPDRPDAHDALVDAAARALVVEGDLPGLAGGGVISIDSAANIAVGDVPWGLRPDHVLRPGEEPAPDDVRAALGGDRDGTTRPVIVQVRDAHRRPDVRAMIDALAEAGATPLVVEWGWPGPRHEPFARVCTRGYSRPGAEAVTLLLRKAGWDR